MTDTHEARIAALEKLVRELQENVLQLQKQISPPPEASGKQLRSRGMLGSPRTDR